MIKPGRFLRLARTIQSSRWLLARRLDATSPEVAASTQSGALAHFLSGEHAQRSKVGVAKKPTCDAHLSPRLEAHRQRRRLGIERLARQGRLFILGSVLA
ncbi:MAG: hypothetical protein ACK528_08220 [Alphaproteobacteria bacterium]